MAKLSVNQALLKANSCLKKGQISEAEEIFKTILATFPKNKRAQIGLSNLPRQNINLTESATAPASKLQPLILNYNAGKHSEAVTSAQNLIVEYPNDARIWNILGATNLAMGNIDKSQTAFKKVLELNPKSPDGHNNLGITFKEQKDFDAAINSYRRAIELKNDYAEAYNNLGNALREKKSFRSAKEAVCTAIKLKDKFSDGYINLAKVHQDEGNIQDAISNYEKAISLNPKAFEAYNNLGIILKNQGRLKEALETFENAISISQENNDLNQNYIRLLTIHQAKKAENKFIKTNLEISEITKGKKNIYLKNDKYLENILNQAFKVVKKNEINTELNLSQAYRFNSKNLNCSRHIQIFNKNNIIPKFCFNCYKVQVDAEDVIDLIKLQLFFDEEKLLQDRTRKCMVELRDQFPGFYKGIIYCETFEEVKYLSEKIKVLIQEKINSRFEVKIKRGCSEFEASYPKYNAKSELSSKKFKYQNEWRVIERNFDKKVERKQKIFGFKTKNGVHLEDILIIQNWMSYAIGMGDTQLESQFPLLELNDKFYKFGFSRRKFIK